MTNLARAWLFLELHLNELVIELIDLINQTFIPFYFFYI